jgi:carboxypeptidase C (cathepsin A)
MPPLIVYLNSSKVHELLDLQHMTGGMKSNWSLLDLPTVNRYIAAGDYHSSSVQELEDVLNQLPKSKGRPVYVLYYVGVADIVCSSLGVHQTLESLQWRGNVEFNAMPWVNLPYRTAADGPGGRIKSAKSLTLIELGEAGHLVSRGSSLLLANIMSTKLIQDSRFRSTSQQWH